MLFLDRRTMSQKILAFTCVVCGVGLMIMALFSCMSGVDKLSTLRGARLSTHKINDIVTISKTYKLPKRLSTSEKLRYNSRTSGEAQVFPYDEKLIDNIRSHISLPSLTRPRLVSKPHKTDRSQVGQSALVDKLLSGRQNGFFVECGAADGETYSNSLFFEMKRNWTGILIDANPTYHRALLKRNRRAYVLHACLSTERRPMAMYIRLSGVFSVVSRGQTKTGNTKVNCFPLDAILKAINVTHVDYFSLDVEGPELEILHTIDWSKLQVDVLSIEYRILRREFGRTAILKTATLQKLQHLRQFFYKLGVYREVTVLPAGADDAGALDVVFSHV